MKPRSLLVLAATLAASNRALADDEPIEVVVRGSTAGAFTSRASADTAPREPIDATSILAELPSVHIRRLGADGAFAALSVRGSASSQVGVVLAGIPLTSAADPSFDLGSLPLWPGASFRVYRGFAPASLGTSGYLGGVLSIDAPSPALGPRTEWWTAAGSFGGLKLRVGDTRKVGDLELGTGLFASRSDGDFTYELPDPVSYVPAPRVRTNAGHVAVGGLERVSIDRPWGHAGALIFADVRRLGVPGPSSAPTLFPSTFTSRVVAGADASIRTGEAGAVHLLAWGRRETSELSDPRGELTVATSRSSTRSAVESAGLSAGWRGRILQPLTVDLGVDGRAERFVPGAGDHGLVTVPTSRFAGGLAAEIEWRPTRALTVNASGRLDARRDDASGSIGPDGVTPLGVSTDFTPTGHAGASYRFADAAVLSAHAGALGRPPSFQELYGNGAALVGDPLLRPERALSLDAGLHGDAGDARAAIGYEIVGFVTSATDLITFVPLGYATFRAVNIDRALLGGLELSASLAARHLRTQVSYTLLFTDNQSENPAYGGRPLPGRPQHDLAYDASYTFGPIGARYSLDLLTGTTVDAAGTLVVPPRALHGAGLWIDLPGALDLRAGLDVENLADLRILHVDSMRGSLAVPVSDFLGFPLPGRSFWLTLRMRSRR